MLSWTFLRLNGRELAFGFFMCFLSGFGQTYFISLFAGMFRAEFDISDGAWGSIYSAGTIASAAVLIWSGRLVDRLRLADMATLVLAGLAVMCVAAGAVWSPVLLIFVIFGLRQFGQGLASHTGVTAMARRFTTERGRAVSIASMGHTAGDATLPIAVVAIFAVTSWRNIWFGCAVFLVAMIPLMRWLVSARSSGAGPAAPGSPQDHVVTGKDHTLGEMLREPSLWLRAPALLAPSFVYTGLILHQITMANSKGWPLALWASSYLAFAVCSFGAVILAGVIIDRVTARRLVKWFLAPLALSCLALWYGTAPITAFVFMAFMGLSAGVTQVMLGAIWSELYGVRHIGAIRAFGTAAMVLSTGLAPAIMGLALDAGVTIERIALIAAIYCLAAALLAAVAPSPARETLPSAP